MEAVVAWIGEGARICSALSGNGEGRRDGRQEVGSGGGEGDGMVGVRLRCGFGLSLELGQWDFIGKAELHVMMDSLFRSMDCSLDG